MRGAISISSRILSEFRNARLAELVLNIPISIYQDVNKRVLLYNNWLQT